MLLCVAVVKVLSSNRSVKTWRLLMVAAGRVPMGTRVHEVTVSTPQGCWECCVERQTCIVRTGGCHEGTFGLGVALVLNAHALKTLGKHIGGSLALLHAVNLVVVAACHVAVVATIAMGIALLRLEVVSTLALVVRHGVHFCTQDCQHYRYSVKGHSSSNLCMR